MSITCIPGRAECWYTEGGKAQLVCGKAADRGSLWGSEEEEARQVPWKSAPSSYPSASQAWPCLAPEIRNIHGGIATDKFSLLRTRQLYRERYINSSRIIFKDWNCSSVVEHCLATVRSWAQPSTPQNRKASLSLTFPGKTHFSLGILS